MDYIVTLSSVAFIWTIAVITPGPNFFITIQSSLNKFQNNSKYVILGISVGTVIWASLGFMGLIYIIEEAPLVFIVLKIIGGVYLIYLGIKLLLSKDSIDEINKKNMLRKGLDSFKLGLFTNLSNPKTAIFITSLFATILPTNVPNYVGFLSIILMFIISLLWYSLVAYIFSKKQFINIYNRFQKQFQKIVGSIFILFGLKVLIQE